MIIDVDYDPSVAKAPAGFTATVAEVVSYYESAFTNPVTITIDVGYGEIDGQKLGSGALGESEESSFVPVSYAALQSALVANADANGDTAAAASLPATSPVNGQYWVTPAEAKALGLSGAGGGIDGYVGFAATANLFAYDDSSGVPANEYDFFGVAAHEISEVMGRQLMVGERSSGAKGYEPLDLFHYSAPGLHDFTGTKAGYASADGGDTALDHFNTKPSGDFGDWAASAGNDSYLASFNPGTVDPVTAADLTVMNLLGWDPSATSLASAPIPPVIAAHAHDTLYQTISVSHAQAASSGVLAGESDSDPSDTFSVSAVDGSSVDVGVAVAGAHGDLTLNADGSYSYTASHSGLAAAEDIFDFTVSNNHGVTTDSMLTVLVTHPGKTYLTGPEGGTIRGGSGTEVLDGTSGNMTVTAGTGAQWLVGGTGDTLTGGSGADTFMFAPGFGKETIDNFNTTHDVIDLPKMLVANFAAVHADMQIFGANTLIELDAADAITISQVATQQLHAHNFHFIV